MNLTRRHSLPTWDLLTDLQQLSDRLDRVFATQQAGQDQSVTAFDWTPAVNISESEKAYLVRAYLPEVKKDDVMVSHEKGVLTLRGERRQATHDSNERFHRVESSYGRFLRRFTLPDDVLDESIEATFNDGTLTVVLPKAEGKPPRTRQIRIA